MRCAGSAVSLLLALASLLSCPSPLLAPGPPPPPGGAPGGQAFCPDGQTPCPSLAATCCLSALSKRYVCCPHPKAVCCEDGLHCCPQCFSCSPRTDSCVRPAASAATLKISSLLPSSPPSGTQARSQGAAGALKAPLIAVKAPAVPLPPAQKQQETATEESGGFVSGFFSAVRSTLFSSGLPTPEEPKPAGSQNIPVSKPAATLQNIPSKPLTQATPGVGLAGSPKVFPSLSVAASAAAASQGKLLPGGVSQKYPPVLSKSPNVVGGAGPALANQNRGLQQQGNRPVVAAGQQQQQLQQLQQQQNQQLAKQLAAFQAAHGTLKTGIQQPSVKYPAQPFRPVAGQQAPPVKQQAPPTKVEEKEKGGFFSSVLSAVTDKFYSNKKEEVVTGAATPKPLSISVQKSLISAQHKPVDIKVSKPPFQHPGTLRSAPALPPHLQVPQPPRATQGGIPQRGGTTPPKPVDTRTASKLPTPQTSNIRPPPAKPVHKPPLAHTQIKLGVQQKLGHPSAVKIGVVESPRPGAVRKSPAVVLKPIQAKQAPIQKPKKQM